MTTKQQQQQQPKKNQCRRERKWRASDCAPVLASSQVGFTIVRIFANFFAAPFSANISFLRIFFIFHFYFILLFWSVGRSIKRGACSDAAGCAGPARGSTPRATPPCGSPRPGGVALWPACVRGRKSTLKMRKEDSDNRNKKWRTSRSQTK